MNSCGRLFGALPALVSVCLLSAPSFAQMPNWPKQNQIDLAPFEAVAEDLLGSPLGNQGSPDPSLQKCEMSKERSALVAGLTPQGTRQINPAVNTPDAANGLTTKVRSIDIYSTATGCAKLDSEEYLATVPDQDRAAFSAQHVQQPVFIRARFITGSLNKKGLRADNSVVIQHLPTGRQDYPWVVRTWNKSAWKGTRAAYGIAHWPPMISITLGFHPPSSNGKFHTVQLIGTYMGAGHHLSPSVMLVWFKNGHAYSRMWTGELVKSIRDEKLHGINFSAFNMTDFSWQFDCHVDGVAQDYYRVIDTYDCEAVSQSEFGKDDVFRSSKLVKLTAEAEAKTQLSVPVQAEGSNNPDGAAECVKAYAAARVCQNIPSDPFGITRGICTTTVKNKFGGSGCKLPF